MSHRLDAANSIVRRSGVPGGWKEVSVGDLARIVGGGTPDRQQAAYWRDGTIPWITPTDLTANRGKYIEVGAENITDLALLNSNATLAPKDSIVFSTRGTVGSMALAAGPITCNQSCEILLPKSDRVDAEFFYYLLQSGLSAFIRLSGGTTFGSITRRDIARVRFAVPVRIREQTAIASVLGTVDKALERTRFAVGRARELDHSLLHELLERGMEQSARSARGYPNHWTLRRLDEVADIGSGVTLGKDVSGFKTVKLPYLRVANVQDGHLDLSSIKSVRVRVDEVSNYRLEAGDVLMTEGGDIDKLGRGTIWDGQIPDCLHQNHIFRIRPRRESLEPGYYALVVESDYAKAYFNRVAKRTTNLASTNKTQVRAFRFPVPPTLDEQRQIVRVMKASKATIAGLLGEETALLELRRTLIHDLLNGRVRVDVEERRPRHE